MSDDKLTLPTIAAYVIGGLTLLSSMGALVAGDIIATFFYALAGILVFPPTTKWLRAELDFSTGRWVKIFGWVFLIVVGGMFVEEESETTNTSVSVSVSQQAESSGGGVAQRKNRRGSSLSFAKIRERIRQGRDTEVQLSALREKLRGQRVTWTGWVDDVSRAGGNSYEVLVDMDPPDDLSVYDVSFITDNAQAAQWKQERKIRFQGTIREFQNIWGSLDIKLHSVQILQ